MTYIIEKKLFKIRKYLFFILIQLSVNKISAQALINGPFGIVPGVDATFNSVNVPLDVSEVVWSANHPSVSFPNGTIGNSADVRVSKNITACSFVLTSSFFAYNQQNERISKGSVSKTIEVYPFLTDQVVYPGESTTVINKDNCISGPRHYACLWSFSSSDVTALYCQGGCNSSYYNLAVINCPSNLPPAIVSSGVYLVSCYQSCVAGTYGYNSSVNVKVKLHDPTITGIQSVGCGGTITTGLMYTVSQVTGANHYEWEVPNGWSITSGANTKTITVSTNGTNAGNVKVRAFYSNGSAVKSNLITFPVGCCTTDMTITSNVNAGNIDKQQAANSITAGNTINNNATAKYHAGIHLKLVPGFTSNQGSDFHAYIEGCNGEYLRLNPGINEENEEEGEGSSAFDIVSNDINKQVEVVIKPNPTLGIFKIKSNLEHPKQIVVHDVLGREVKNFIDINSSETEIDLANENTGIYMVTVYYQSGIICKRIIKN